MTLSYKEMAVFVLMLTVIVAIPCALISVYQMRIRAIESRLKLVDARMERYWMFMTSLNSDLNDHIREEDRRREVHRCCNQEAKRREKRAKKKTAPRRRRRRRLGKRAL